MSSDSAAQFRGWPFSNRTLALAAALGLSTAIVCWFYRCRKSDRVDQKSLSILKEVENKKARGVEAYRHKKFTEAIHFFCDAIEELRRVREEFSDQVEAAKLAELMSLCENNNAACFDELGNTEKCLEHCDLALQFKPNYEKAMRRRARTHLKLGHNDKALHDYLDLTLMENVSKESLNAYHSELDRVADAIVSPLLNELIQNRIGKPMKIPQMMVSEWMLSTVTNDPLLAKMAKLGDDLKADETRWVGPLDEALFALNRGEYDEIASLALAIVEDENNDLIDRMLAVLLATRFLSYQTQKEKAMETAQKFDHFWDRLDEAQKLAHKDAYVAYITLQLTLTELVENDSLGNEENVKIDETATQRCHQLVEEGLRINPENADPLVTFGARLTHVEQHESALDVFKRAKKIDQKNPFIRYYEINARLTLAIRQGNFTDIQNHMSMFSSILMSSENVPAFAFVFLSKFAMILQNNQLVLEACQKVLEKMPNCAYAIYLLGLVDMPDRANLSQFVQNMENAMQKAIETDPNYWEPYRIMAKIYGDKKKFTEASLCLSTALSLARKREEMIVLLKEQLMINAFAKRVDQGKNLPRG